MRQVLKYPGVNKIESFVLEVVKTFENWNN